MVKYLAMAAAVIGSLAIADLAQARGHHGCATCGGGYVAAGGCPGGVCSMPMGAPAKMAVNYGAPAVVAASPAPASVPVVTPVQPSAPYVATYTARRGLFGWRR